MNIPDEMWKEVCELQEARDAVPDDELEEWLPPPSEDAPPR